MKTSTMCARPQSGLCLDVKTVLNVLTNNQNKFLTIKFITAKGEERVYNGRLNVQKYLRHTERSEAVSKMLAANDLIPFWVEGTDKVKSFKADRVVEIKADGKVYKGCPQPEGLRA